MNAEFFDIFGVLAFLFITIFAGWMFYTNKKPKKWTVLILLIIGLLGLIVDSIIVYNYLSG